MTESNSQNPEDAFSVIGNETRIEILEALARAEGPLSFSNLYDRVDSPDSAQFNYHLGKLVGHFVVKYEGEYDLSRAGERVVEAILSGTLTEAPTIKPQRIDASCHYCGSPINARYRDERVDLYCSECEGTFAGNDQKGRSKNAHGGYLGGMALPPAGIEERSLMEIAETALLWSNAKHLAVSNGVCPQCSAKVEYTLHVCEDHDEMKTMCERCENRYAAYMTIQCGNCTFDISSAAVLGISGRMEVIEFLVDQGINPVAPQSITEYTRVFGDFKEEILSIDPPEIKLSLILNGNELSITIDEDMNILSTSRAERQ